MDFVGLHLIHNTYGDGVVETVSSGDTWKIFTVKYTDKTVAVKYPDVFVQGIVAAADPAVQETIMAEIEAAKKAALEEIERKMEQKREAAALAASKPGKAAKAVVSEPDAPISVDNPLVAGKKYGTSGKDIYEKCVKAYGFTPGLSQRFMFHMYAQNATKEGYSVWMLVHSNWTDTKNENWSNTISEGYRLITEDWGENDKDQEKEPRNETRVTFAKDAAGAYVFLGVFKCTVIDSIKRIKKYELISDKYPTE